MTQAFKKIGKREELQLTGTFSIDSCSDLELGGSYSNGLAQIPAIINRLEELKQSKLEHKIFVFNGDIFDFEHTHSRSKLLQPASNFLTTLVKHYPEIDFKYIVGNHDGVQEFEHQLAAIQKENKNFKAYEEYVRINDIFYTHGDLQIKNTAADKAAGKITAKPSSTRSVVPSFSDLTERHLKMAVMNVIKCFATSALSELSFNERKCVDYLGQAIDFEGIKHVNIGHIHTPLGFNGNYDFTHGDKTYNASLRVTGCSVYNCTNRMHSYTGLARPNEDSVLTEQYHKVLPNEQLKNLHGHAVLRDLAPDMAELRKNTPTPIGEIIFAARQVLQSINNKAASFIH